MNDDVNGMLGFGIWDLGFGKLLVIGYWLLMMVLVRCCSSSSSSRTTPNSIRLLGRVSVAFAFYFLTFFLTFCFDDGDDDNDDDD